ncbi:conjugal transfer protein TraH [Thorsellia kenyensis]|uniref:Conjugal transfer protein TraH n=1 Tax=Thorsellia kenyensis TaxID=1549888 RepID=A0ABV6CD94_9GAMM
MCLGNFSLSVHGSMQSEMERLLGSMTNTTQPGVYETQRRGVISGGSIVVRNKIMDESLLSFVPPSMEAGCAGLDMYAGSLSFINADQFIQLLRSVASNAKGYAFQLALSSMCEKCSQHIETLQKKVQQLNEYFGNSCQLAQGVVNDSLSALQAKGQNEASLMGMISGSGDIFTNWSTSQGKSPYENLLDIAPKEVKAFIQGNLVWRALKKHAVDEWFITGDEKLLESIMSLTGSLIVGELVQDKLDKGQSFSMTKLPGQLITLEDLLLGGEVQQYACDDHIENGCLNPQLVKMSLIGLSQRVAEMLLGNGESYGIITKYAKNLGSLNEEEIALLSIMPGHIGSMVRTLSALNESAARGFSARAAPFIALDMARIMVDSMLKTVLYTLSIDDHSHSLIMRQELNNIREDVNRQYQALIIRYGSEQEIIAHYNQLLQLLQRSNYLDLSHQ